MKKYFLSVLVLLLLVSCSQEQKTSNMTLKKVSFSDLKGFENDDMEDVYNAFIKGCKIISEKSGDFIGNSEIRINRLDYLTACNKASNILPVHFKEFIKNNFSPWMVLYNNSSTGKFTAYYESELRASFTRDDIYKYPVYGRPYDLIELNLKDFDANLPAKKIVGRIEGKKLIPYYTRAEINQQGANAPVLLWADSYIDIYIMQIQGSAVAKLTDGSRLRIAFAESNGRQFKGIGSILLNKKLLKPGQASMGEIKKWLKSNPELASINMDENKRYIFHRISDADGPIGALGVPLTAGRSLAVDCQYIPLGSLLWLETNYPNKEPLNKLVIAQDIGGAIKGGVRGDYFWGSGGDDVLEQAGRMNSLGKYFILIPNSAEVSNGQKNE